MQMYMITWIVSFSFSNEGLLYASFFSKSVETISLKKNYTTVDDRLLKCQVLLEKWIQAEVHKEIFKKTWN